MNTVRILLDALRERLAQPQQWEQLYPDIGNPFKRPATRDEKIVRPGVYEVTGPLHVVCQCDKCKAQPEQAWITAGPHTAPLRTHWEGCEEVHPECKEKNA